VIAFDLRHAGALASLAAALREGWYELVLSELLPGGPFELLTLSSVREVALADAIHETLGKLGALFDLFAIEEPVPASALDGLLDAAAIGGLVEMGFLNEDGGLLRSDGYRVVPYGGLLLAASGLMLRTDAWGSPVGRRPAVYLGSDSASLCGMLQAQDVPLARGRALDLCTGSGVAALCMARLGAAEVVGAELVPEAVEVARTNVALNGLLDHVRIVEGDLFEAVGSGPFDLVSCNPPFVPCPPGLDYLSWGGGGANGLALAERIVRESRSRMRPGAPLLMVLRSWGDARRPELCRLLDAELGPVSSASASSLMLAERHEVDSASVRQLAGGALVGGSLAADDELEALEGRYHEHLRRNGWTHEYWASLRLDWSAPGYRLHRLYRRLDPRSVLEPRPDVRLRREGTGMYHLERSDGRELTGVPELDARFLSLLDGRRSIAEAWTALGASVSLERCVELGRVYLRAGALREPV
jgi:SAM-dependent methyltransferase